MELLTLLIMVFLFVIGLKLFIWLLKAGIFLVVLPLKILFLIIFAGLFLGLVPVLIIPAFLGIIIPLFPLIFVIVGIVLLVKYAL